MEILEALLSLAALWPVVVGAVGGVMLAALLHLVFPSVGPGVFVSFAFLGAVLAVIWLAWASSRRTSNPGSGEEASASGFSSSFVLLLAFVGLGCLWGALITALVGIWSAASALLLVGLACAPWLAKRWRLSPVVLAGALASLLLGLALSSLLSPALGHQASNPSIERTFQRPLRALWPAAHVKR